jgi:recombination protein RecA
MRRKKEEEGTAASAAVSRRASKADAKVKRKELDRISDEFKIFRPVRDVITTVRSVPTILCQLDHALGVGGFPFERFSIVHGPAAGGKTSLCLALIRSFLRGDHFAALIDAEYATPIDWVETAVGKDLVDSGRFFALRPESYEQTVEGVREFVTGIASLREKKQIRPETTAIVIVDSIKKLVPADFFEKIMKGEGGLDGAKNRGAQLKARMNGMWLDQLTPLLAKTQTAVVAIAREMEDPDADARARQWGRAYKVQGGSAIEYDSSVAMRAERASWVFEKSTPAPGDPAIGERIRVTVRRTKISGKEDRSAVAYFNTSMGTVEGIPEGFDIPRDLLEFGSAIGVVEQAGSWYSFEGEKIGNGTLGAVKALHANPDRLRRLEIAVRDKMKLIEPGDGIAVG